jgi:predicted dinucleotide-binding enzyme
VKITVVGRGHVGGGLARLWEKAGHDVMALGRDGGDGSGADVVLVAVPGDAIAEALGGVSGIEGKPAVDATNAYRGRPDGFESLAQQVKSILGGPVAKAFNLEYAQLYDQVAEQRVPPTTLYAADDEARDVTEQLIRDAGYEPVRYGGLDTARTLEDQIQFLGGIGEALGPHFRRYAKPGEL